MVFIKKLKETSKLQLSLHVRVDCFSKTCKKPTRISLVIVHTKFVVYVSCFSFNVEREMLRHMTVKLKILTVPN